MTMQGTIVGALVLGIVAAACAPMAPQESAPEAPPGFVPPPSGGPSPTASQDPDERPPAGAEGEFTTDFSIHSVPYSEILSGGPPKDGIPALFDPETISVEEADAWLAPNEAVVAVEVDGQGRAYPVQVLMWHEIVNDEVEGLPLAVTYCPLCNTAIAFERTFQGQVLDFGTTGRLRFSNLIMYDRQTETWWQQATGEAIAGEHTGARLAYHPAVILSWSSFKQAYPTGSVASRETGHVRAYGANPYQGYDDLRSRPFLYRGPETPAGAAMMDRVLVVEIEGETAAFAYRVLDELGAVNDVIGGEPVAIFWQPGVASALDAASVSSGRDVGTAVAFSRIVNGEVLTFRDQGGRIFDEQTGSEWVLFGQSVAGPLEGSRLDPVVSVNHFWFSAAAFDAAARLLAR